MRDRIILVTILVLIFAGSAAAKRLLVDGEPCAPVAERPSQRIVSLVPSLTETLFALGLGDRVVGVSRFCRYPPQAAELPKVGGYVDPNFEAIVALRPDLIVMLEEHEQSMPAFEKLGLRTLSVRHKDVDGILASIPVIGRACGAEAKAAELVADIRRRLDRVRQKTAGLPRPRVMVAVNRALGSGRLDDVYVAAGDGHLGRIVELAGGQNACPTSAAHFPTVSNEGILFLNPDIIIDVVDERTAAELGTASLLADWRQVADVEAIRRGQVYIVSDDHATIPGPDFISLVERLARLIHPEVDW
jgi:iron complex transport system substrate-binding protein